MPKYLPGARVSRMFGDGRWYDSTVLEARRRGHADAAGAADLEGGPTGPETLRYHMMQTRRWGAPHIGVISVSHMGSCIFDTWVIL